MNDAYEKFVEDIKKEKREPTRQEFKLLGRMYMSDKWFSFKQRIKGIFKHE